MVSLHLYNEMEESTSEIIETAPTVTIDNLEYVQVTYGDEVKLPDGSVLNFNKAGGIVFNGKAYADFSIN